MDARLFFSIIFVILSAALMICAVAAFRSEKGIGRAVGFMLLGILPPVIGNFLIIISAIRLPAEIGCYMYYIGIDITVLALLNYITDYCKLTWVRDWHKVLILTIYGADITQLLANTLFGHAFGIEEIQLYGRPYFRMIPYLPQNLHRLLVYSGLAASVIMLFIRMSRSSRIHARRYAVIFFTMVFVILWCTFYVVSRTPLDRSMIGYGVFGLLVFYFSLYYKPVRLLDRILVNITSELQDALFFFDDFGVCIWANKAGLELTGIDGMDFSLATGRLKPFFEAGDASDNWVASLVLGEEENRKYYDLKKQTIRDDRGRIDGSFLNVHDVTKVQMELQAESRRARHDELTGLYTRTFLYQKIRETLDLYPQRKFCVLFVNISNFKLVNDVFGNSFGDEVLRRVADLIEANSPLSALYGRLVSDTFGVFLPMDRIQVKKGEQILGDFTVSDGDITYHVLLHVGIYEIVDPSMEISVMFDRARIAASSLRNNFQNHIIFYDDEMRSRLVMEQKLSSDLMEALESRQIIPYLQPLVDTDANVVGAEALVRWNHPEYGFLPPYNFVPVFERNGMIAEMDRYMWRYACELLAEWKDQDLFLSINVSPKDFYFTDVVQELKSLVEEFDIAPERLRVEITESIMISDEDNKIKVLKELREVGFVVEMDDFGSGYSSLNMLKNMPIDVIKIDMLFLRSAGEDERSMKILNNIINMSTDLEIVPLTEGVESKTQYENLSEMGCKLFQGYYFGKPMPVEEFEKKYVS